MNATLFRIGLAALALATAACSQGGRTETSRMDVRSNGTHLSLEARDGVVSVLAASPAGRFGVNAGDRVLRVDGHAISSVTALTSALTDSRAPTVPVVVQRNGSEQTLTVTTALWQAIRAPEPPRPPDPPSPPGRP
ncbi:PDZ domain-containing protein [Stenotrophomonas sp.]|uniref:PDZ domain-containing protein n=1 Tax=Stenotrophomonas sp. TaxID=69392 RepID=UPI00289EEAB4|nr:PDZ domain-containing protein [Stenotrophomonas sp.]